jgi:uncharacterized protein (TIGR03435 family)
MNPVANHLWQSTVFGGVAALLALALRNNHARTRYWVWMIASVKFLIPFSVLVAVGSRVEWTPARTVVLPEVTVVMQQISQPFPQAPAVALGPVEHGSSLAALLAALWGCGFLTACFLWWRRWSRIRSAVHAGSPLALIGGVPVVSAPVLLEPGVFGIFRPVLLLPQGITEHLTPTHLEAIVAHELCHVRRRDNLAAAVHMVVEAIFWFHPLVWWMGSRLVEEREHACDEEVLGRGSRPEVYAESILKTCQFYLESPLVCMSGISGSDLKKRIVRIMSQRLAMELGFGRKLLLAAVGTLAIALPILAGLLRQTAQAGQTPSFEVASIKPNKSGDPGIRIQNHPGTFEAINVSLKFLIEFAYNINDTQLSGAAGWIDSENYNIEAKTDDVRPAGIRQLLSDDELERRRLMLRSLLADRFQLAIRHETKELPIYELVVAKNGSKLHEAEAQPDDVAGPGPKGRGIRMGRGELIMTNNTIGMLADALSRQLGRIVTDGTGLRGSYDFTLKWTPGENEDQMVKAADARSAPDGAGPSIFTAIQEQLGLKLESKKGPVDILVIEHVEPPSAN